MLGHGGDPAAEVVQVVDDLADGLLQGQSPEKENREGGSAGLDAGNGAMGLTERTEASAGLRQEPKNGGSRPGSSDFDPAWG